MKNDQAILQHFFTREGGVSTGLYAGLNCGAGSADDPQHVAANKRLVAQHFGLEEDRLLTLKQVHSADVVPVQEPFENGARPEADALVTRSPNLILGILTADCAPVLFRDEHAGVIGAAHAGWKGAYLGVLQRTIAAMQTFGAAPQHITASIGPCIAQKSYEVGPEFKEKLVQQNKAHAAYFIPSSRAQSGHNLFDLAAYVRAQLQAAGITQIEQQEADTCAQEKKYFSYRRSCLRNERDYGRQISCIVIKETNA